jgi:pimeloyl-ACP methyl ester carboxylesterase
MSYVDVAGHATWHEVHGHGDPVVFLHGAFGGASSFDAQLTTFVRAGFHVHLPERRGHAHTADIDGPITYALMAGDTIAYLETVLDRPAHLVGWSDGAVVALLVARARPDLVDRLVLIGQYYNSSGRPADSELDAALHSAEARSYLRQAYDPVSPDGPEHFEVVLAKLLRMFDTEPELDLAGFATVTAPTLVVQGDRDEVTVEHSLAVVAALEDARLAVLPGSHLLPVECPDVVNPLLIRFLRDELGEPVWGLGDPDPDAELDPEVDSGPDGT